MTATTAAIASAAADDGRAERRGASKARVQLDLTPRSMNLLAELKDKTEASSYAEVIRNALKLYDGLITEAEAGAEFYLKDKQGKLVPFKMFL